MDYTVFNDLLEGVQVISADLRYVYLNESVKKQAGIQHRDVIGLKCEDVFPGIEQSNSFVKIQECLRTGDPINFLNRFDFPDGSTGYFELRMNPTQDGVLLFSVDRTDEMHKEELVRLAHRRYETITNSIHSALFEWDSKDKIVFGNTIFNELCFVTIGHECSTLDDVLHIGGAHQKAEFKYFLDEAIREKKSNFSYYLESNEVDEKAFYAYQFNVVICYDDDGAATSFVGYILDATEERKIQRLRELRVKFNNIFLSDRPLEACLEEVLQMLLTHAAVFRVAECWLPNYDGKEIRLRASSSVLGKEQEPFLNSETKFDKFNRNIGLPGICMEKRELIWWNALAENEAFQRKELLMSTNLKTGIAIPVESNDQLVAVITLFSENKIDKTMDAINQLASLTENIGHGIASKRIAHQRNILNDSSTILLMNTTPTGEFIRLNPVAAQMFQPKGIKNKSIFDIIDGHEKDVFMLKWSELIKGKTPHFSINISVQKANGQRGTLKLNASKGSDDDSLYIVALDISREEELYELLSLSNKMAAIGFWSIELQSKKTILSGNARKMLGLDELAEVKDMKMKFMKSLMPAKMQAEMVRELLAAPQEMDLKWSKETSEGLRQYRLIARSEFNMGKCGRISAVVQDITSIVKTEQELEVARDNYLDLIDLSPIPIWLQDPVSLKFELANRKACEIYGYSLEEFTTMDFRTILHTHDQLVALERDNHLLAAGKEVYLGNFKHVTKSGEFLLVDNFARMIDFKDKKLMLVIGVDRTESIALQQEISKAVIQAQESQKEEISKELHDNICQLMVSAQLYLGMLIDDTMANKEGFLAEALHLLEKANFETRQLSHALSSAKFTHQTFHESVEEVINSFQLSGKIHVNMHLEPEFVNDKSGPNLKINLIRLLQEGMSNSVKHSGATEVNINGARLKNQMILSIWDNGKGFDTKSFKPGIGIYNMQNRVQVCNGELDIHSEPGHGTLLEIRIPTEELLES
jgi:PAS domain S-box-containing protein